MTEKIIAYPGDRPPMICTAPVDYRGTTWGYAAATPAEARRALAIHARDWADWEPDSGLACLAVREDGEVTP